ncbi:hypothetical protein JMJ35_010428 [Cladonia borealis]|uniref:Uncharacterized protein n=1 Tax=Cladonia borealis TaxID=184061 RepID=A0AA39V637_9LECA|nr:hypothetical protein JMJ35_010428 [Cladonia borealis]
MTVYDPFGAVGSSFEPFADSPTSSTTAPNTTIPNPSAQLNQLPIHMHFNPTQSHPPHQEHHHRTLTQNPPKISLDPSIRDDTKDPFPTPKELQHAYQTAEEHSAFAEEKSCNSSTSMSKLPHSHTENTPPQPHHHADTAAQIQSSLSTNNDAAVPISINDALFVDEKTEEIATRDPRMSSAEVKTRFLTEEQLREAKQENESGECEAGKADAGDERGYGARNGGEPRGDIWTGGSKIGESVSGTEE